MAVDTFIVFAGVYDSAADAEADYEVVKDLHTKAGLIDAYDAAVIVRRADGKVKIAKKHETPTRAGGVMSRHDLKELGEHLDAGQAGLVVVGVSDMQAKIERAMKKARKVEAKQMKADTAELEADAKASGDEAKAAGE